MQRKYSYFWLCLSRVFERAYLKAYNGQFKGWTAFITFGLKANIITSDMFQIISPDKVNFCSDCESELMTRIDHSESSDMEKSSWGLKRWACSRFPSSISCLLTYIYLLTHTVPPLRRSERQCSSEVGRWFSSGHRAQHKMSCLFYPRDINLLGYTRKIHAVVVLSTDKKRKTKRRRILLLNFFWKLNTQKEASWHDSPFWWWVVCFKLAASFSFQLKNIYTPIIAHNVKLLVDFSIFILYLCTYQTTFYYTFFVVFSGTINKYHYPRVI